MNWRRKSKIFSKDRNSAKIVNLKGHLTETVCLSDNDCLVSVVQLKGISFESKTIDQIAMYKDKINSVIRGINDPSFAIWACWLRREDQINWRPETDNKYSQYLCEEYLKNIDKAVYENRYYLAFVYRVFPRASKPKLLKKNDFAVFKNMISEAVPEFETKMNHVVHSLSDWKPTLLGVNKENRTSDIGAFYSDLIYGTPQMVAIRNISMSNLIYNRRLLFGKESVEIRHQSSTEYAACLGIKEYQETTDPTMTLGLNSLPFKFNLVQSFCIMHRNTAQSEIKAQRNRMISAGDDSISQIESLTEALDGVAAGRIVFGEHNMTFTAFAPTLKELNRNISEGKKYLEETDGTIVREDIAMEGQYISQVPANTASRARASMISSLNLSSYFPMFNEPTGKQFGHHWGQALLPLISTSDSVYWLTTHLDDVGSALILGQTGCGKTVIMSMMLAMLQRQGFRSIFFDKDQGAKLVIKALGGVYHDISYGRPTNFNPFCLKPTSENTAFLVELIELLAGGLSADEKMEVSEALRSIYGNIEKPRLSTLKTFLNDNEGGLVVRLNDWFEGERYGWVFDNENDNFSFNTIDGIDITEFLDNDSLRTPILAYLFFRIKPLIDGEPIALFIDEFSKALEDPYFENFVDNEFKTIRKKNGILVVATQSPGHALNSKIACSIIEQTPTKILLANEFATREDYVNSLKFTEAEWDLFRTMTKESRLMLIKAGGEAGESIQCSMPLGGSPEALTILSGTTKNTKRLEAMEDQYGRLPSDWVQQIVSI